MTTCLLFLIAIWCLAAAFGVRYGGFSEIPAFTFHPSCWLAETLLLGSRKLATWLTLSGIGLLVLLGWQWSIAWAVVITLLAPFPYFLIDIVRRDTRVRGVRHIWWNPISPLTTTYERVAIDDAMDDIRQNVAFYIPEELWAEIPTASGADKEYLKAHHKGGGVYSAPATNDLLSLMFSLGIRDNFIIHPGNLRAVESFASARRDQIAFRKFQEQAAKTATQQPVSAPQAAPAPARAPTPTPAQTPAPTEAPATPAHAAAPSQEPSSASEPETPAAPAAPAGETEAASDSFKLHPADVAQAARMTKKRGDGKPVGKKSPVARKQAAAEVEETSQIQLQVPE